MILDFGFGSRGAVSAQAQAAESVEDFAAQWVVTHTRHIQRFRAKSVSVIGEVRRGRCNRVFLKHSWNDHSMPSRFCICSSGTPLVPGAIVFTQKMRAFIGDLL